MLFMSIFLVIPMTRQNSKYIEFMVKNESSCNRTLPATSYILDRLLNQIYLDWLSNFSCNLGYIWTGYLTMPVPDIGLVTRLLFVQEVLTNFVP